MKMNELFESVLREASIEMDGLDPDPMTDPVYRSFKSLCKKHNIKYEDLGAKENYSGSIVGHRTIRITGNPEDIRKVYMRVYQDIDNNEQNFNENVDLD